MFSLSRPGWNIGLPSLDNCLRLTWDSTKNSRPVVPSICRDLLNICLKLRLFFRKALLSRKEITARLFCSSCLRRITVRVREQAILSEMSRLFCSFMRQSLKLAKLSKWLNRMWETLLRLFVEQAVYEPKDGGEKKLFDLETNYLI